MLNFVEPVRRAELLRRHFDVLIEILKHCDFARLAEVRALELSGACSYWKEPVVLDFCEKQGLTAIEKVDRCAYSGAPVAIVARHTYKVASNRGELFSKLKSCQCSEHLALSRQNLEGLGEYPYTLALKIARNLMSCI